MSSNNDFPKLMDLTRVKNRPRFLEIHPSVEFGKNVTINVTETLVIGAGSKIRDDCIIEGRFIKIGKNFIMNHHAEIGGGSCFEPESELTIGDDCHLGSYSIINTARTVLIGSKVGMGRFTNLYTHGSYLNPLEGFPNSYGPIIIGNNVWIPSATILPNTNIGNNVVISLGAKVSGTVPAGSHIAMNGDLFEKQYPKTLTQQDKILLVSEILKIYPLTHRFAFPFIEIPGTMFDLDKLTIRGKATWNTEKLRHLLRRNGIRFNSIPKGGAYEIDR